MRSIAHLSVLPALLALLAPLSAAESGDGKEKEENTVSEMQEVLKTGEGEGLSFPSYDERRDVFYSMIAVVRAEKRLAEIEAADRDDPTLVGPVDGGAVAPVDTEDPKEAEQYAQRAVAEVESFLRSESWERAMDTAERHMNRLRKFIETFPDNQQLAQADTMLRRYYVLAENKKLYEEARAQFEALGLRVEGIIWSADQPSLAIISGEPVARGVNDRVRGTVVKNIDQNRVDFMYSYRQRRFHFQLYLEPKN